LRLKVEEIAPSPSAAQSQAASLGALISLARGFTAPLGENAINQGLKDLLKTAEVTENHNRVTVKATVPGTLFAGLASDANHVGEPGAAPPPAH
jgi:hypothetical protein